MSLPSPAPQARAALMLLGQAVGDSDQWGSALPLLVDMLTALDLCELPKTASEDDMVEVQITLVACPRNQPRPIASASTWYVLEQIQPRI